MKIKKKALRNKKIKSQTSLNKLKLFKKFWTNNLPIQMTLWIPFLHKKIKNERK